MEHPNAIKKMKVDWIDHVLCMNCLLKHAIEGKTRKDRSDVKNRKKT
jgi:hypothetical protein